MIQKQQGFTIKLKRDCGIGLLQREDCNYYLVDEKVKERRIGSVRERGSDGEMGFGSGL